MTFSIDERHLSAALFNRKGAESQKNGSKVSVIFTLRLGAFAVSNYGASLGAFYWSLRTLAGLALAARIDWLEMVNNVAASTIIPGRMIIHQLIEIL